MDKKFSTYMHRCFELAQLGESYAAPNPMVGAVLVHEEGLLVKVTTNVMVKRMQK
jgi:diaminohydroxyphosphoribosylaminopyrimidine deaminase/5-amino-6-(5-phosphoribosylamino)uracil reductase